MRVYHRSVLLFIAVILSACMAGCTKSFESESGNKNETDMGSHHVVVKPAGGPVTMTCETSVDDTYEACEFARGDVVVRIENEALSVNGKPYGTLDPGDSVLVDRGKVSVNGKPREVVPVGGSKVEEKKGDAKPSGGGTP